MVTGTPFATYRLGIGSPMAKVVVTGSGGEGYEDVLRGMLRALAVLGFRGEVRLRYAGNAVSEDGGREALADLERFAATLEITDEYAEQVKAEQQEGKGR